MARATLWLASTWTAALVAGCATHETYGDRAVPPQERAVVEGYSRYQGLYFEDVRIVSVDGSRAGGPSGWPYASSASVPAGTHWVQVLLSRNESDIAMCAFEWTFEGGVGYKLQRLAHGQSLLAHASARFPASISMIVSDGSARRETVSARAECGKEASCRETPDCPAQHECRRDAGFDFGTCRSDRH